MYFHRPAMTGNATESKYSQQQGVQAALTQTILHLDTIGSVNIQFVFIIIIIMFLKG